MEEDFYGLNFYTRNVVFLIENINKYWKGRCNIEGAISLFLNIAGAIAPVAPVLNTPLISDIEKICIIIIAS